MHPGGKVPDGSNGYERIVGGQEAEPNSYPFMVSLVIDDLYFCGGSLIGEFETPTVGFFKYILI